MLDKTSAAGQVLVISVYGDPHLFAPAGLLSTEYLCKGSRQSKKNKKSVKFFTLRVDPPLPRV